MTTTYDIAKRARLNQCTVSRALSRSDKVRPETLAKVLKACRELDYVPNFAARSLRTKRSLALAVYIPYGTETVLADPFVPIFLSGVNEEAARHGYSTLLVYPGPGAAAPDLVGLVKSCRADGVVLTSPFRRDARLRAIGAARIPCVTAHCRARRTFSSCTNVSM